MCEVVQSKASKLQSVPFLLGTTLAVASILNVADTERVQAYVSQGIPEGTTTPKIFNRTWLQSEDLVSQATDSNPSPGPDVDPSKVVDPTDSTVAPTAPVTTPVSPATDPTVPSPPVADPAAPETPPAAAETTTPDASPPLPFPDAAPSDVPPTAPAPGTEQPPEDGTLPTDSGTVTDDPTEPATLPTPSVPGEEPAQPPAFPPPSPEAPPAEAAEPEPEVLVSEVLVEGADGDLALTVYEAISTRPGEAATRSQIQADINAIFATGFFSNVRAEPSDTALGVRVTFFVQPNPDLRAVQVAGNQVLSQETVDEIFSAQYGRILNLKDLQTGIQAINKYYQDEGYVLAQVIGSPQVDSDGTVTLQVAEGVIEDIDVRYLNEDGEPTKGKTRKFIITRELDTKPGDVLNRPLLQTDLQRVFGLGLFEDVQVALEPGQDPRKVLVNLNVQERSTGSFSAGAGFSSRSGFFGTGSYSQSNFGGNNQKLNLQLQLGTREFLFDASFTDPWIATDPFGTSYTVNLFNRLTIPLVFDEGPFEDNAACVAGDVNPASACDVRLPNGDSARVNRLGGGITFTRPLTRVRSKRRTAWTASVGAQYQRVSIRDADFRITPQDSLGNDLSFSGTGSDDLFSVRFGLGRDLRNDPLNPTKGSALRLGVEQWLPIGSGSIAGTRLRGSYSQFLPVKLLRFTEGPQALAFNVQAGTVIGDLPPYEAFTLGGGSSVRGYSEGDLGSGRSFLQATAEYRFPLLKFLGGIRGVLFFDVGTNLGTQDNVPGSPGIIRGKPGSGFGYGIGIRVNTPIGPVRLDYGLNDEGDSQFHFGFGERF